MTVLTNGDDTYVGSAGDDVIYGLSGDDSLSGLGGADQLYGGDGADSLFGGDGDDSLHGGLGDDTLFGGAGVNRLDGGDGQDLLVGGAGKDTLAGGQGNDWLQAGSGHERLIGGAGDDFMQGGDGPDTFYGGQGDDIMSGGKGRDHFYFVEDDVSNPQSSTNRIMGFQAAKHDWVLLYFDGLTPKDLAAAFASPGADIPISNDPGANAIRVEYASDVAQVTTHGVSFHNDPNLLDTHIVVTLHNGATADLWVWDAHLDLTDAKALLGHHPGHASSQPASDQQHLETDNAFF